ncbi:MAG: hypothetical protein O2954_01580 [bacterium]|nr:hypothetical protein [bacterium]
MANEKMNGRPNLEFCKNLRTKRYYFSDEPPARYLAEETATTGYWCLRTMGNFGPDDAFACPGTCTAERMCYASSTPRPV